MNTRQRRISVLMFPWLAHGHISPFLELAKKLAERNFYIYFCSTPVNLNHIKPKLSPNYSSSIHFVELHLPTLPDLPPLYHTTNGLPPHLMNTLKKAFHMAGDSFFTILKTLNPDLLVYDYVQHWAPAFASLLNIPALIFLLMSAATNSFFVHLGKKQEEEFPFAEICLKGYMKKRFEQMWSKPPPPPSDGSSTIENSSESLDRSSEIIIVKTFRELEGKFIDYLSNLLNKKMVPVGPLVQSPSSNQEDSKMEVIEWLDKKEKSSAVFVAFGSECFLSNEQREEIAHGLELSRINFIWVLRFPVGEETKLEEALPRGYLERVSDRGLVVEGWAPQVKILAHSSIGGFVSHCGWSSVMESMKFGVPIIAIPMQIDQPFNARLVEDAGVGIEVNRKDNGEIEREEIAKIIRKVAVEEAGDGVRKRAREMSDYLRNKGEEEIDGVVDELVHLCNRRTKP